jgi:2-polyprenyl-6-methoxyphenol hydroxylase-like FAD-dependent oxidoreductase
MTEVVPSATDHDVVVVGGGPVGMLLAAELGLQKVSTALLEKLPRPTGQSRAGTLHARTVQTLARRGLLDPLLVAGGELPARHAQPRPVTFHFAGMFGLDLGAIADEFPAVVGAPQHWAEELFAERATELGVPIQRGHEVVGLVDEGDHVRLTVHGPTGEYQLTTRYVVGCDGGRSNVRKLAGIDFPGSEPTVAAMLGEIRLLDPFSVPGGWHRTERGWTVTWLNPYGTTRILTFDWRAPHPDRRAPLELPEFQAAVEHILGVPVPMTHPTWLTRFSDAARQAETYRKGRVLLAGDAAHTHFPVGAQGLNLGLQDAVNLGWKLAAAVRGWAPDDLLDSYYAERRAPAARVLHNTRAQAALMNPDPAVDPLRELFFEMMGLEQVNAYLGGMISGLEVRYDLGDNSDPLVGRLAPDLALTTPHGGVRLAELLHPGRPLLLDLADRADVRDTALGWADRVDIVRATADQQLTRDAILVRPDGYVAWSARTGGRPVGDQVRLKQALTRWFGAPQ